MTRHKNIFRQEPKQFKGQEIINKKFVKKFLFDADFRETKLSFTNFDSAMLEGARFDDSELESVSMRNTHLAHAKFRNALMINADLSYDRTTPDDKLGSLKEPQK